VDLVQLLKKVVKVKASGAHFSFQFPGLLLAIGSFSVLNEAEYISHAQYTGGKTVRIKRLEGGYFLPSAEKFYGHPSDKPDGESCPASGITIQLC